MDTDTTVCAVQHCSGFGVGAPTANGLTKPAVFFACCRAVFYPQQTSPANQSQESACRTKITAPEAPL